MRNTESNVEEIFYTGLSILGFVLVMYQFQNNEFWGIIYTSILTFGIYRSGYYRGFKKGKQ